LRPTGETAGETPHPPGTRDLPPGQVDQSRRLAPTALSGLLPVPGSPGPAFISCTHPDPAQGAPDVFGGPARGAGCGWHYFIYALWHLFI